MLDQLSGASSFMPKLSASAETMGLEAGMVSRSNSSASAMSMSASPEIIPRVLDLVAGEVIGHALPAPPSASRSRNRRRWTILAPSSRHDAQGELHVMMVGLFLHEPRCRRVPALLEKSASTLTWTVGALSSVSLSTPFSASACPLQFSLSNTEDG